MMFGIKVIKFVHGLPSLRLKKMKFAIKDMKFVINK